MDYDTSREQGEADTTYAPYKPVEALRYALLFSIVSFLWAPFVATTPSLRDVTIPYLANNPVISFPVLIIWPISAFVLSKRYLKQAEENASEGLKLGATFAVVSLALDLLVVVFLVGWESATLPNLPFGWVTRCCW